MAAREARQVRRRFARLRQKESLVGMRSRSLVSHGVESWKGAGRMRGGVLGLKRGGWRRKWIPGVEVGEERSWAAWSQIRFWSSPGKRENWGN